MGQIEQLGLRRDRLMILKFIITQSTLLIVNIQINVAL
jgi:hypothetical protein